MPNPRPVNWCAAADKKAPQIGREAFERLKEFLWLLDLLHGPHVAPQLGTDRLDNGIANCLIDIYQIKIVDGAVLKIEAPADYIGID